MCELAPSIQKSGREQEERVLRTRKRETMSDFIVVDYNRETRETSICYKEYDITVKSRRDYSALVERVRMGSAVSETQKKSLREDTVAILELSIAARRKIVLEKQCSSDIKGGMIESDGMRALRFRDFVQGLAARDLPNVNHVISTARYNLPIVHCKCSNGLRVPLEGDGFGSFASILQARSARDKEGETVKLRSNHHVAAAAGYREECDERRGKHEIRFKMHRVQGKHQQRARSKCDAERSR